MDFNIYFFILVSLEFALIFRPRKENEIMEQVINNITLLNLIIFAILLMLKLSGANIILSLLMVIHLLITVLFCFLNFIKRDENSIVMFLGRATKDEDGNLNKSFKIIAIKQKK